MKFTPSPTPATDRIRLPFGSQDLDPQIVPHRDEPRMVRCFVRGCQRFLQVPTRGRRGDVCPEHGIRCHHSSGGSTYTFANARRNIIASPDLFATRVIGHPFKFESHRFGFEKSEDALSWNVFRSLMEAGLLGRIGTAITGITAPIEPTLYLWGLQVSQDAFEPWSLLIEARKRFEGNLPVERPLTEPDIALHLPGKYLILIEAKFTSPNTVYERGGRKDASSLTLDELLGIYQDPHLRILNRHRAEQAQRVHYQLWRNTIFAEWMGKFDHRHTRAFHVNLVREGYEEAAAREFAQLIQPEFRDRFQRLTWEDLYRATVGAPQLTRLHRYLETKTAGLAPAFKLPRGDR